MLVPTTSIVLYDCIVLMVPGTLSSATLESRCRFLLFYVVVEERSSKYV
jgi:hypothetical protein